MRFAVLSDLHLGAQLSALNPVPGPSGSSAFDSLIQAIKPECGKLDYLVLLGDIFDLSMVSFRDAWASAQGFFSLLDAHNITDKIIYVPGNHDFTMWHYFEQDIHVTRRTQAVPSVLPEEFCYSVPGFLNPAAGLVLPTVGQGNSKGQPLQGGFFRGIWSGPGKEFAVVYPNLYVIGSTGATLLTHGQYFDGFWNFLGNLCLKGADRFLDNAVAGELTISELVQVNYPTSVLDASAIGQAGIFSKLAQAVTKDVSSGDFSKVEMIKYALLKELDDAWKFKGFGSSVKEWMSDKVVDAADRILEGFIEKFKEEKGSRYNSDYVKSHLEEIRSYLRMSTRELEKQSAFGKRPIERLIFGHTHIPSGADQKDECVRMDAASGEVLCRNTGGWITNSSGEFHAGVALFDSANNKEWIMRGVDSKGVGSGFEI